MDLLRFLLLVLWYLFGWVHQIYPQTSNIGRTFVSNKIVDHSDVVGASPVGAAPTTPSFSTQPLAPIDWAKTTARRDKNTFKFWDLVCLVLEVLQYYPYPMSEISKNIDRFDLQVTY